MHGYRIYFICIEISGFEYVHDVDTLEVCIYSTSQTARTGSFYHNINRYLQRWAAAPPSRVEVQRTLRG